MQPNCNLWGTAWVACVNCWLLDVCSLITVDTYHIFMQCRVITVQTMLPPLSKRVREVTCSTATPMIRITSTIWYPMYSWEFERIFPETWSFIMKFLWEMVSKAFIRLELLWVRFLFCQVFIGQCWCALWWRCLLPRALGRSWASRLTCWPSPRIETLQCRWSPSWPRKWILW